MDHVLNSMQPFADVYRCSFLEELQSDKNTKYQDCPSYADAKAINDAMNVLRKHIGVDTNSFKDFITYS